MATAAGAVAITNTAAVQMVNERVSDLDDYQTVAEAAIFYPTGQYTLDAAAKADLDKLAALALSTDGYMIEIAGYASKTGTKSANQQLSEDRAPQWQTIFATREIFRCGGFLRRPVTASTHPLAENTDPQGRALDRRVDVKLVVNKGLQGRCSRLYPAALSSQDALQYATHPGWF